MIIGICGFIGSGKSTAGNILVKHGYTVSSFASKLKDVTAILFGWERHLLEGDTEEGRIFRETIDENWSEIFGKDVTPRYILQFMGTEVVREKLHPDFWVHSVFQNLDVTKNYVFTDARFPNEIEKIKSHNGKIIVLSRGVRPWFYDYAIDFHNGDPRAKEILDREKVHPSEYMWLKYEPDIFIQNDGSISDLETTLCRELKLLD